MIESVTDEPSPEELQQLGRSVTLSGVLGDRDRLHAVVPLPQLRRGRRWARCTQPSGESLAALSSRPASAELMTVTPTPPPVDTRLERRRPPTNASAVARCPRLESARPHHHHVRIAGVPELRTQPSPFGRPQPADHIRFTVHTEGIDAPRPAHERSSTHLADSLSRWRGHLIGKRGERIHEVERGPEPSARPSRDVLSRW